MKAAPLVLYDQVATGAVRFELFGDAQRARTHLHTGRVLLAQMKAHSGIYDLQAQGGLQATGGTGFVHRKVRLSDGSVVQTIHNDGQDTVRIISPTPPGPRPAKPKTAQESIGQFQGACGGFGGGTFLGMPWVWKDGFGFSVPDGHDYGEARGISWDADTACGIFINDEDPFNEDYNFLWTRTRGTDGTTENLGKTLDYGNVTCISGDGRIVGTDRGFYWSRANGWQQVDLAELPGNGPRERGSASINAISGDGSWMAGYIGVDNEFGGEFKRPCLWRVDKDGSAGEAQILDDGDGTWESVDVIGMVTDYHVDLYDHGSLYASGDVTGTTFGHYEDHEFVQGTQHVANSDGSSYDSSFLYQQPLEPFTKREYAYDSIGVDDEALQLTNHKVGTQVDITITHHPGGQVTGVRYDGSAACGFVAQQDVPGAQAAIWISDHSLRILGLPEGYVTAQAMAINQSGDVVVCGYGQTTDGTDGAWTWSEATGFVDISNGPSNAVCITQEGDIVGGFRTGTFEGLVVGEPASYVIADEQWTNFERNPEGGCNGITKLAVTQDRFGNFVFDPPMPGLNLDPGDIELWPLAPVEDFS